MDFQAKRSIERFVTSVTRELNRSSFIWIRNFGNEFVNEILTLRSWNIVYLIKMFDDLIVVLENEVAFQTLVADLGSDDRSLRFIA